VNFRCSARHRGLYGNVLVFLGVLSMFHCLILKWTFLCGGVITVVLVLDYITFVGDESLVFIMNSYAVLQV